MEDRTGINGMVVSDYFSKNTDFSASDFTLPDYKLWIKKNLPKNKDVQQGYKAWVGQLVHKASYDYPETDVIKEFSFNQNIDLQYSIGGSIDRVVIDNFNKSTIEDLKTMGNFPATKAFKDGKEEWVIQLSVYSWAMSSYGFNMNSHGIIHQYVMGYQKNKNLEEYKEYNKIKIDLMSKQQTEDMMLKKINVSTQKLPPLLVDCQKWMCKDYCDYNKACPSYKGD